jgi:hypothetical protein
LLLYSSKPSLGVFQLAGHLISYTIDLAPSSFSGAVAGDNEEEEEAPTSTKRQQNPSITDLKGVFCTSGTGGEVQNFRDFILHPYG